ncbi:MAG TPA: glycosyltransferase [Syntrophales bacterium]|nr:glycosyltransferase [Syntrophales bacterium]
MISAKDHISICICTYKRPQLLTRLLDKLRSQKTDDSFRFSVVIVDNDAQESGRVAALSAKNEAEYEIDYHVEPERNISFARNRTVKNAKGNLIAFIDDDEFPDDNWLINHYQTLTSCKADGVLGPVKPHFDGDAPAWLVKSGLLERKSFHTRYVIRDYHYTRTGNVLLWKKLFDEEGGSFDPAYGISGGGDAVFFKRMMERGKIFVWSNDGIVYETVTPERQTRMYYVKRAFTRGMTAAWEHPFLSTGTVRSLFAIVIYTSILPFALLWGQPSFMKYLIKECDHISKILAYLGIKLVQERPY